MKKTLMFAFMALLAAGLAFGGTITVTQPAGGSFALGAACPIHWTASGVSGNVKIQLIRPGGALVGQLANRLDPASSPYPWVVAAPALAGETYRIRVSAADGSCLDESERFSITAAVDPEVPGASIQVTEPNAGSSWPAGSSHTITWTKSGDQPHMVAITLRREGAPETEAPVLRIADGAANNMRRPWPIPPSLAAGRYFVRIRASDAVSDDSAAFTVSPSVAVPAPTAPAAAPLSRPPLHFRVNRPRAGDVVATGTRVPIEWQAPSLDSGEDAGFTFTLKAVRQSDSREFPICANYYVNPGSGATHNWNVDQRIYDGYPGDYRIRIVSYKGLVAESPVFSLTASGSEDSVPTHITIYRPRSSEELAIGSTTTIEWRQPPAEGDREIASAIKLEITESASQRKTVLAAAAPNHVGLNYFRWFIDPAIFGSHPGQYTLKFGHYTNQVFFLLNGPVRPYTEEGLADLDIEFVAGSDQISEVFGENPGAGIDKYRVRGDLRTINLAHDASGGPQPDIIHVRCQWFVEVEGNDGFPFPNQDLHYIMLGPIRSEATIHHVDLKFLINDDSVDEDSRIRIRFVIDPDCAVEDYSVEGLRNNVAYSPWFHPRN